MIYRQYLVMRKAVVVFWGIGIAAALVVFATTTTNGGWCQNTSANSWIAAVGFALSLFAGVYGAGLGNASRESARVFWVLPRPRWTHACDLLLGDLAGIAVAGVGCFAIAALFFSFGNMVHAKPCTIDWTVQPMNVVSHLLFCYAVYGWSTLVGMIGRRVAYAGLIFLPAGFLWFAFSNVPNAFGAMFRSVAMANPFIVSQAQGVRGTEPLYSSIAVLVNHPNLIPLVFLVIAAVTCAAAVTLWQRMEAFNA